MMQVSLPFSPGMKLQDFLRFWLQWNNNTFSGKGKTSLIKIRNRNYLKEISERESKTRLGSIGSQSRVPG